MTGVVELQLGRW